MFELFTILSWFLVKKFLILVEVLFMSFLLELVFFSSF